MYNGWAHAYRWGAPFLIQSHSALNRVSTYIGLDIDTYENDRTGFVLISQNEISSETYIYLYAENTQRLGSGGGCKLVVGALRTFHDVEKIQSDALLAISMLGKEIYVYVFIHVDRVYRYVCVK